MSLEGIAPALPRRTKSRDPAREVWEATGFASSRNNCSMSQLFVLCAFAASCAAFSSGPRLPARARAQTVESLPPAHFIDSARVHIHKQRLQHARRTYEIGLNRFGTSPEVASDLFLRAALLEQRANNQTGARELFKHGARACPHGARLFCSWGLFENKHGHGARVAGALLRHAVALDASIAPVLRWSHFRTDRGAHSWSPRRRRTRVLLMSRSSSAAEEGSFEDCPLGGSPPREHREGAEK